MSGRYSHSNRHASQIWIIVMTSAVGLTAMVWSALASLQEFATNQTLMTDQMIELMSSSRY